MCREAQARFRSSRFDLALCSVYSLVAHETTETREERSTGKHTRRIHKIATLKYDSRSLVKAMY